MQAIDKNACERGIIKWDNNFIYFFIDSYMSNVIENLLILKLNVK